MTRRNKAAGRVVMWLCICALMPAIAMAQDRGGYKVNAALATVPATGFYKIPISPALTACANDGLTDVRIADSNTFVPYVSRVESRRYHNAVFTEFPIISNNTDKKYTVVVMQNMLPGGTDNLSLVIRNTAVERATELSGSDDNASWYIINDYITFERTGNDRNKEGNYVQTINFPYSKSRYYKLKIHNEHTDPLSIVQAGVFRNTDTLVPPGYQQNPAPTFTQKDSSNGHTYLLVRNGAPYVVSEVALTFAGPKFYNRDARAYVLGDKDSSGLYSPAAEFKISSSAPAAFKLNAQKTAGLVLEIDNKDNPPLKLTNITTSQTTQYIVAWLEKGKQYTLLAGNIHAAAPDYDLASFKDSIPAVLQALSYGPLQASATTSAAPLAKSTANYWLWPAIIIAILALSYLTYKLLRDMKQKGI